MNRIVRKCNESVYDDSESDGDDICISTLFHTTMINVPVYLSTFTLESQRRRRRSNCSIFTKTQLKVPMYNQRTSSLSSLSLVSSVSTFRILFCIILIVCIVPIDRTYAQETTPVRAPNFGYLSCGLCERGQLPLQGNSIVPAGTISFITEDVTCNALEQRAQNAEFAPSQCIEMKRTAAPTICGCEIPQTRPPATRRPIRPPTAPQPIPIPIVTTTPSPSQAVVTTSSPIAVVTTLAPTLAPSLALTQPQTVAPTAINETTAPVSVPVGPLYSKGSGSVVIEMRVVSSTMSDTVQQYFNRQFQIFMQDVWQSNLFDVQSSISNQLLLEQLQTNVTSTTPVNATTTTQSSSPSSSPSLSLTEFNDTDTTGSTSNDNSTTRHLIMEHTLPVVTQMSHQQRYHRTVQEEEGGTIVFVPIKFECSVTALVRSPPLSTDLSNLIVEAITLYSATFIDLLQGDFIANNVNSTSTGSGNATELRQGILYNGNHYQRSLQSNITDPVERAQNYFANLTFVSASIVPPPPTPLPPTPLPPPKPRRSGLGLTTYIGIGVGGAIAIVLLLLLFGLNRRKNKRREIERRSNSNENGDSNDPTRPIMNDPKTKNNTSGTGNKNTTGVQTTANISATASANNAAARLEQTPIRGPIPTSPSTGPNAAKPQATATSTKPLPSSYNPFAGGAADTAAGPASSANTRNTNNNNISTPVGAGSATAGLVNATAGANGTGRNSNYNNNAAAISSARPQSSSLTQKQPLASSTPSPSAPKPAPAPPVTSMFAKKNPAATTTANVSSTTTPIAPPPPAQPTSIFQRKQAASEPVAPITSSFRPTASTTANSVPNVTNIAGPDSNARPNTAGTGTAASGGGGGFSIAAALASTMTGRKQQIDEPKPAPAVTSPQKTQQPTLLPPPTPSIPPQDESTIGSTSATSYNRSKYGSGGDTIGDDNSLEQQTLGGAMSEYGGNDAMSYAYSLDAGNMNDGGTLGGTIGGNSYQPSQGNGTLGGGYGSSTGGGGGGGGGGGSSRYSDTGGNTSLTGTQSGDDVSSHAMSSLRQNMVSRTVIAPPGKLGIVIDTTLEGPVVHKVNQQSPLEGSLFPGDIIVAIDDVDTRAMSASAITALMVRTANLRRKLTVLSEDITN